MRHLSGSRAACPSTPAYHNLMAKSLPIVDSPPDGTVIAKKGNMIQVNQWLRMG
jgi:hypothetical protein